MAIVFKLRRDSTDVNLLAAAGAGLRTQKWYPRMGEIPAVGIPPYVEEDLDVLADCSSDDNLATILHNLDDMRRYAPLYEVDDALWGPVWLHAKMDGETGERRAYVRKISGEWRSDQASDVGLPGSHDALLRLKIERHPCWESDDLTYGATATPAGVTAYMYDYTTISDIKGTVPARSTVQVYETAGIVGLDRIWMGMRSELHGIPANFANVWECEDTDATAGTDCGAPAADAAAHPGGGGNTMREVDFATTPGWAKRWEADIQDITSNYVDCLGRFLWLFRTKVDTSTVCEVQLRFGHTGSPDADWLQGPILEVSNDDYDFYEMGQSQMPPATMNAYVFGQIANYRYRAGAIQIWARRTSGSGSLYLDGLFPIPLDEGWLIAKNVQGNYGVLDALLVWQTEYDRQIVQTVKNSSPYAVHIPHWAAHNFRFPPGDGRLVAVMAQTADSVLTGNYSFSSSRYYRWANLRGNDV